MSIVAGVPYYYEAGTRTWAAPGRDSLATQVASNMLLGICPDATTNAEFQRVEGLVGGMGIRRCYQTGGVIPASLAASRAAPDVGFRTSWLSISNVNPAKITDGSSDATLTAFANDVGDHPMMLTFNHEPENDGYAASAFRNAANRFYDVVKAANPKIKIGPVYMDWTFDPASGKTPSDWTPTVDRMDFAGIDTYNVYRFPPAGNPATWYSVPYTRILNFFTFLDSLSTQKGTLIPPAVGEFGCANWEADTGDAVGTKKAGWIDDMLHYFETRGSIAMCYFDTDVNNDYNPNSFIEADAPSRAVWSSWTATHTGWPT